ncbi:MAG: VIT1/CCC1 transporter family protein [Methanosarcinales archaeon]|nr:VIT1/CCC1 transporter family protein [Methanosarcinales archaeon]
MDDKIECSKYIILGSTSGILAILGVVTGASVSGDTTLVINTALAGAVALALANGIGSFVTLGDIELGKLTLLEKPLMRSLDNTKIEQLTKKKIWAHSLIHTAACFVGSMLPILPFMLLDSQQLEVSMGLSIASLAVLGVYWGRIMQQNILLHSIRMAGLGGVIAMAVNLLFRYIQMV